jgi:hypothetical protein
MRTAFSVCTVHYSGGDVAALFVVASADRIANILPIAPYMR